MTLERLEARLDDGTAVVGVVGLGYVGLPVACLLASTGLRVVGVDLKAGRVAEINGGKSPILGEEPGLGELLREQVGAGRLRATTDYSELSAADAVLVSVETPVDESDHRPRYQSLARVCEELGAVLAPGTLVIIESTISPGTVARLVIPALERSTGRRAGADFFVGHCPERVMPGRLLRNLTEMSRVVGGQTPAVAARMAQLYGRYVRGDLDQTDVLTAELVKTAENAYRDVNIAFANQVALIAEQVGGDAWKVRELVNKSPGRLMLLPGAGVGGHCIPKDSWLLAAAAPEDVGAPLLEVARALNEGMPGHVADLALQLMSEHGLEHDGAVVAVLGYAYLEDSDDVRHSPSAVTVAALEAAGCQVRVHDPYVPEYQGDLDAVAAGADCAVVMVAHSQYRALEPAWLAARLRHPLLVDGRHVFGPEALRAAGLQHRTVGAGQ
jgi:UDP-N-acetyl-D-mannosaminuronic acid dehydrogenase